MLKKRGNTICCEWRWILVVLLSFNISGIFCYEETVTTLRGQKVELTCPIDVGTCGDLHSVKWFKGTERIAVLSGDGEIANIESKDRPRMSIDHSPKGPITRLQIKSVEVSDEETYVCETTFLVPVDSCDNLGTYSIDLKVLVPPSSILVLDKDGNELKNNTQLGPMREGQTLAVTCDVKGARPAPTVGWYRSGKRLTDAVTIDESNGLFSVKSVLSLVLSRQELGSLIECRVETTALQHIVSNQLTLDLQVRPTKISLTGVKHHTVQGTKVLLQCQVIGARPAANVTWYNSTKQIDPNNEERTTINTKMIEQSDGTFETISAMVFTATRFENGASIRCEGDNVVMRDDLDKPIHETIVLEVLYPPVVTVKPDNVTVNETADFLLFCEYEANPASLESVKWLKNGRLLNLNQTRYEGGDPEQTALLVKNSTRDDIGLYTCELSNVIGSDVSDNEINVDIQYVPIVELDMEPEVPIIENNESNVTLYCNVVKGNPTQLLKVRWFLDGQLLKELPECQYNNNDSAEDDDNLCGIDPSKMLLQNVGRDFLGNYSCEGFNAAGWGPRSMDQELIVYYAPGNATLVHSPQIAVKKQTAMLTCSIDDVGNPPATKYRWLRGNSAVMDVVTPSWPVYPIGLDSRTNFSCFAYNDGGEGNAATIQLDVHAPPAFINKLRPYTGALYSTSEFNLSCQVECVPQCNISWFKDGIGIDELNERYTIKNFNMPAVPATADFESTLSVLHFNMAAWPDGKLDIFKDSANYSCVSTNNSVGPGVRSTTYFGVEYPPENTTVSNLEISVIEGSVPQRVLCSAKAYPEPTYEWRRSGEIIAKGNALIVNKAMQRVDAGPYTCISYNRHGSHSADAFMNVLFKPNCTIIRKEIDSDDTLICKSFGNPADVDFDWSLKSENDTIDAWNVRQDGTFSYLILEDDITVMRTYRCVANNSVGTGTFCEIDVAVRPKRHLLWWQRWDRTTFIILVASVAALLLAVIIICIIIICICRKRRRQNKYHTDLSISATQSVLSVPTTITTTNPQNPPPRPPPPPPPHIPEVPKSPPKWPLRPGVMVHVKVDTKQNLCAARTQSPKTPQNSSSLNVSYASPISPINRPSVASDNKTVGTVKSSIQSSDQINPPELPNRNNNPLNQQLVTLQTPMMAAAGVATMTTTAETKITPPAITNITPNTNSNDLRVNINEECDNIPLTVTTSTPTGMSSPTNASNNNYSSNNNNNSNNNDELINFTSSNLIERILRRLRWRRERYTKHNANDSPSFPMKTNKRAVNLLRGATGWFGSGKSTTSNTGLFDSRHRLSGIKYTDGVVTYKRTPLTDSQNEKDTATMQNRKRKKGNSVPDKSSAAGVPLTEPGEYENLPFHGLQTAPNKSSYLNANTANSSNVVRVAPRPKNPSNYNYNLANSFPSNFPANFYPNNSNFPNIAVNTLNYSNHYPSVSSASMGNSLAFNPFLVKANSNNNNNNNNDINTMTSSTLMGMDQKKPENSKKFNSLKSLGIRKSPQFYSMRVNKSCKRHNSFGGDPKRILAGDINSHSLPYHKQHNNNNHLHQHHQHQHQYDQPLYENLTDSIQIHESSLQNESSFGSVLDEYGNCEMEQNSIYRSDSGISNSSYECITPVPAPRTMQRKCQSVPVYVNLPYSHHPQSTALLTKNNMVGGCQNHHTPVSHQQHNSKCKANSQNAAAFVSYERTQTNPFVTSSRRQQILVPKELFPSNPIINSTSYPPPPPAPPSTISHNTSGNGNNNGGSCSGGGGNNGGVISRRPVKLPLRKHHSFHFQPSQTATVAAKQKKNYKNNGPLVFKPLNEKNAFKPITPVPKSPNRTNNGNTSSSSCSSKTNKKNNTKNSTPPPRICGTSLKRHVSNIEGGCSYDQNKTMLKDHYSINGENDDDNDDGDGDDDDDDDVVAANDGSSSIITDPDNGTLVNGDSVIRGQKKRLVYADLAPLSKYNNSHSGSDTKSVLVGEENIKLKNFKEKCALPTKRTTQYATLKFNEVNI